MRSIALPARSFWAALAPALFALLLPALARADAGVVDDGGANDAAVSDDGGVRPDGGAPDDAGAADDGGLLDAGAADAGPLLPDAGVVVDAGPQRPPEEGRGCDPLDGANCGSLYCVPYPSFPEYGVCSTACDDTDDCYIGRTCQDVVDKTTFETLYSACTFPTYGRDRECHAPLDPDSCANDMSCHIARAGGSVDGVSFNCKVTCEIGDDEADAGTCASGERCVSSRFVQAFEPSESDPDIAVTCTPALCDVDNAGCECSAEFSCVPLNTGANVCALVPGECGTPVRGMVSGEILDGGYLPFEVQCNETSDHRFCDNAGFEGLENPGANLCILEGQLGVPDEGICIPYCGNVDVDLNANGVIDLNERGERFECPEGEQCTKRLARELFLGAGPAQAGGPFGLRGCSILDCPPGTVCPTCGPGETECFELQEPTALFTGVCIGPALTCEYAPDYDAGPPPSLDAGLGVDAGAGGDAGNDPPLGEDAGHDDDDDDDNGNGLIETPGPTVTRDGCACSSARASEASPLGVFALFGIIGLAWQRRRRDG